MNPQVGHVVKVKTPRGKVELIAYVYFLFHIKGTDLRGCQLITQEGTDLGAFLPEEFDRWLEFLYDSGIKYSYLGDEVLVSEFETLIKRAFNDTKIKKALEKLGKVAGSHA